MSTDASFENLQQMYRDSLKTRQTLKLDIDNFYKRKNTNERKVYYKLGNVDNVIYYNKLLKIIYFVILGIYILFGSFIEERQYLNPFVWLMIVIYVCVPFVLKYVINGIFDLTNSFNLRKTNENDDEKPQSSCFNVNAAADLEEDDDTNETGDQTITAPLLVEKCYVRFEGEQCKQKKDAGWAGWRQQTSFDGCYNCDGDTQSGCDAIKNSWSAYCGTNTFNIYTTDPLPGANVCTT